jgi:1,4-dihydroxy-2-naphthoate octaprenyltransferase
VEIRTKIVSVSSFLLGTLYAATVVALDLFVTVVMFLAVLAVDMGTTAFNSFFDFQRQVDSLEFEREADKVLLHEGVAPGAALIVAGGLFFLAVALGLILTFVVGIEIALIGALSMAVGFFYTGGPRPLSSTPFGELFAGGFLGSVLLILSAYVQTEHLSWDMVLISLPSMLLVASILTVNNACDIEGDRAAGRRTLAILLGGRRIRLAIYLQGIGAYSLALVVYPTEPIHTVVLVFAFAISAAIYLRMHRRGFRHSTKPAAMADISRVFLIFTAGAALLLLHRIIF